MSKKTKHANQALPDSELLEGTVIRSLGSSSRVRVPDGKEIECTIRGKFRIQGLIATNPVTVGDEVTFAYDEEQNKGVIQEILPRKNYILRRAIASHHKVHILAANIDQAILVFTVDAPRTSTGFVDRFLVVSEAYHIPAHILINKSDLIQTSEQKERLSEITHTYRSIGYEVSIVSALDSDCKQQVHDLFSGKRNFVVGHSGAGKSTLINLVDPELDIKTGDISEYTQKGRHTTTYSEMHPIATGGYIIDSPGIKEWGITDFTVQDLGHYFPEILQRMSACKFNDCSHIKEPACAVKLAHENGEIPPSRYKNYLKMMEEIMETDNF